MMSLTFTRFLLESSSRIILLTPHQLRQQKYLRALRDLLKSGAVIDLAVDANRNPLVEHGAKLRVVLAKPLQELVDVGGPLPRPRGSDAHLFG